MKAASTSTMVRLSEDDRRIFTTLGLAIPESAETFPAASVAGKAFRRLSLKCHPDKNPSPEARDEFEALQQAYDQVVNEDKSEALKAPSLWARCHELEDGGYGGGHAGAGCSGGAVGE